jgi:hypothetical protein
VHSTGSSLVYAGYIGGNGFDVGYGIAVDSGGDAYVTGYTESTEASFPVTGGPDLTYNGGSYDAFVAKISDATAQITLVVNGDSSPAVTPIKPVTVVYQISGCQNREMYLILNAPALNINWSYLDAAGQWISLPVNFINITPFSAIGPADGAYTLFNGNLPPGDYDLYIACDFIANGHLDYTGGISLNGAFDYVLVHVN